jgi:hypothetical protein
MKKRRSASVLVFIAGCAPAAPAVEADRDATVSSSSSTPQPEARDHPSPTETAAETSGPPDGFRDCFAEPLVLEPPYGEKPLPPGTATWVAQIDAAMPVVVARSREPVVVVPLVAGDARRAEVPVSEARYGAARTLFEHQHWGAAALRFRDIAMSRTPEVGIYAAQLYLECLNLVGTRSNPKRPRCFDAIRTDTRRFVTLYCSPGPRPDNRDACETLERIERDLQLEKR